jgi:hypothetical protein
MYTSKQGGNLTTQVGKRRHYLLHIEELDDFDSLSVWYFTKQIGKVLQE